MAIALAKADAKKELQASTISEPKPIKEKKEKALKLKNKGPALATRPQSSNTTYMVIGLALLMAVLAYNLFV